MKRGEPVRSTVNRRQVLQAGVGAAVALGAFAGSARSAVANEIQLRGVSGDKVGPIRDAVTQFASRYHVPGMSLQISHLGNVRLQCVYGLADRDAGVPVNYAHRFRVASVSKPITSVAIMRLCERRKLTLATRVFGPGGALSQLATSAAATSADNQRRLALITVQHLLEHHAGGWGNSRNDPMFDGQSLAMDHTDLIRYTLANRPLVNEPGRHYEYSNFGYCLLGRIIERLTDNSYEQAVRESVLQPAGCQDMRIGYRTRAEAFPDEVAYYGQDDDPYHPRMRVDRMDAHGGWVATPSELVRFVEAVDGFAQPPDMLTLASIQQMTTRSATNINYAKGWSINGNNNWWHQGAFNGGASLIARIHDGHAWAVLLNTRSQDPKFSADLDGLPWKLREMME